MARDLDEKILLSKPTMIVSCLKTILREIFILKQSGVTSFLQLLSQSSLVFFQDNLKWEQ